MSNLTPAPTSSIPGQLATKPDLDRCLQRIDAWFQQAVTDRPPVRFYKHNAQYDAGKPLDHARWTSLRDRWFDVEYQIENFEASIAGKTFHAETFPVFIPNLGPNVYSSFYGGELQFGEVTSWYDPVITDFDDLAPLSGDPFRSSSFCKLNELTRAALGRCGDRYWVGYPDLHPSLDCLAAWCGVDALFLQMADKPGKLAPLLDLSIRDFQRIFGHFDRLLKSAGQPSITWIRIPCAGRFHVPSCDTSSMFSTAFYREFSLPLLRRELVCMDRAVYHVDGKGVAQHLDVILEQPEIQAIQWVQGVGTDWPILQWIPLLERVLDAGKSVMVDVPLEELEAFLERMPREGVFLCLGAEEGQEPEILRRIERW